MSHRWGGHASGSNPAHGRLTHTLCPTCAARLVIYLPSHELNKASGQRFLGMCGQQKDVVSRALILRRFFQIYNQYAIFGRLSSRVLTEIAYPGNGRCNGRCLVVTGSEFQPRTHLEQHKFDTLDLVLRLKSQRSFGEIGGFKSRHRKISFFGGAG